MKGLAVSALAVLAVLVSGAPKDGQINKLPGVDFSVNFKQYAGYLDGSETHKLFYWFVESQRNPAQDPLVVWFNGMGCSSLLGFLEDNGPFLTVGTGQKLENNPFAWNKEANVLYLEIPAGVGFSYSTDKNVKTSDNQTAQENYNALKHFFQLYPEYNKHDLYLSGEDYAGFHIPILSTLLIQDKTFNLKGLAIGNGFVSAQATYNNLPPFLYYHSLIKEELWTDLKTSCCNGIASECDYYSFLKKEGTLCHNKTNEAIDASAAFGFHDFDTYYTCDDTPKSMALLRTFVPSLGKRHKKSAAMDPNQCSVGNRTLVYLNRKDVQSALHVKTPFNWTMCNLGMHGLPPDTEKLYTSQYENMDKQFNDIFAHSNVRVLLYHGDTDSFFVSIANQRYAKSLNRKLLEPMRPWKFQPTEPHFGGMVTRYDRLDFVTIRAAGHDAASSKPGQTLQVIGNFLKNKPYDQPL